MKRNRIIRIVTSIALTASIFACTNLDETLYDSINADETELTSADVVPLLAAPYGSFRNIYWDWDGLSDSQDECGDLIVVPGRVGIGWGDYYITMHKHTWGPQLSHSSALWDRCYTSINLCNKALYQIDGFGNLENKEAILAEVRALRAIYYYLLYDNFRNIPIVTDFILPDGFLPEQSNGQEVFNFIEAELTESLPLLTEEVSDVTYGRVNKWAAKMTLAKLYLNAKVYIDTEMWDESLEQVNDVIESGKFQLLPTYKANFALDNNTGNKEQILMIPFEDPYTGTSYYPLKTLHSLSSKTYPIVGSGWGGSCAIPQFIDTYDEDDKRLSDTWLGGPQVDASGQPIMDGGSQFEYLNYVTNVDEALYNEGYRMIKYELPTKKSENYDGDVPFYRYADALMIKAECLLRKGQADDAAAIVTEVRKRSFDDIADATVTGAQLTGPSTYKYGAYEAGVITDLDANDIQYGRFLDELAWEFVGEHHRRQDLIRFGVFTTKRWLSHEPSSIGNNIIIFPIPQFAMEANSKLVQNDGY